MPTNILMPALSPTMEKGNLAKWLKKDGRSDQVGRHHRRNRDRQGDRWNIEAVDEGTLVRIVVPEARRSVASEFGDRRACG